MKCEDVVGELRSSAVPSAAVSEHIARCGSCRAAQRALRALSRDNAVPVPRLAEGAFERALQRAVETGVQQQGTFPVQRRGFWLGTAVGGALAASIAVAVTAWWLNARAPTAPANPQVQLAVHETRAVNVSLESPEALAGAEIHVVLTGAIGLEGFPEQRELRWVADLERGVNQLTLPVVALGASGGQVMVEVQHGDRRRAFVIDVQTSGSARPPAGERTAGAKAPAA
jgi:hypothetical protein